MKKISKIVFISIGIVLFTSFAWAGWSLPQEIISGVWGGAPGEFYYSEGDTAESFPRDFGVDRQGRVYVSDELNSRVQIFTGSGILKKIIGAPDSVDTSLGWPYSLYVSPEGAFVAGYDGPQKYFFDINWNFIKKEDVYGEAKVSNTGYLFRVNNNQYDFYSVSGQFVKRYLSKPIYVGIIKSERNIEKNNYSNMIEYDDYKYYNITPTPLEKFSRDDLGYVNGSIKVSVNEKSIYRVSKYDKCGKVRAVVDFPADEIVNPPETSSDSVETDVTIITEHGPPVIGPDGSVYAWKRTPTTYSILKWTWVDSPDDPKGGPDAPADLKVSPSTDGLFLTWTVSPQDPGCVEGYEVERSSTSNGIFSNITTTSPGVVKYNDTGAFAGSTYYYRIRAKSSCGPSPYTAEISGKRP